ncbi:hypothetical protein [Marinicauda sp. Alg238-R41]|uniref:hypothetical protein n=1 Tax=Marinicauda sp. Alg238-R41 TaxID=2993447 RepID=UPI0022E307BE|nr:hypothetical protein [Marinicauda sp. Alg238-R41]
MAIDLPDGFVLRTLRDGYTYTPPRVRESEVDQGAPKQRRDTTAAPADIQARFVMSRAQYRDVFVPWFNGALAGGAHWFNWTEPFTGDAGRAQFKGGSLPPTTRSAGGRIVLGAQLRFVRTP